MTAASVSRALRNAGRRLARRAQPHVSDRNDRVAFIGPMPPASTGIATYDAAVLDGLRRIGFLDRVPLDVVWPVRQGDLPSIVAHRLGILQIGNNVEFHRDIYRLAHHMPSLVTLHDLALDDFVNGLLELRDPLGAAALREAGVLAPRLTETDAVIDGPLKMPCCAAISRRARGIIVHSDFGRRYLEGFGCRTPIFVIPHPVVEARADIERARVTARRLREPLEGRGARTLIVAPGDMNRAKCISEVAAAVAMLDPSIHVVIAGRTIADYDPRPSIEAAGMGARTIVAPDVSDADFLGWIAAADVVVDLRYPHRGEVSGTLARAMQIGRATIVSGTGSYLDLPDDVLVRISSGAPDPHELSVAIGRLCDDASRRTGIGNAARAYIEGLREREATASGYAAAIEATLALLADPTEEPRERWANALADFGVTETELSLGHGLAYARTLDSFRRSP
jgi:glycosyltransferase involved in cell wall biosynthesis